jgi:hypothetical protein
MAVLAAPFSAYVGLQSADTGQEITRITYGNYARVLAEFDLCADGVTIANAAAIQWPIAGSDWGAVNAALLWTGSTLAQPGQLLSTVPTTAIVDIEQYSRARVAPAGISGVIIVAPRPYGIGSYGTGRYGTGNVLSGSAVLALTFDTGQHVCEVGTWAPGPIQVAA